MEKDHKGHFKFGGNKQRVVRYLQQIQ